MARHSDTSNASSARPVVFSETLANLIRSQGLSGKEVAKELGITEAGLSHYLKGRATPSFDNLIALQGYFEVSLDYLVYGTTSPDDSSLSQDIVVRQVQRAISNADRQSARRQDLMSRLSRVMVEALEDAVDEVISAQARKPASDDATNQARTITNDDASLIEMAAISVDIISALNKLDNLTGQVSGTTLISEKGEVEDGPFLQVQASNLMRGITYRQLLLGPKELCKQRAAKERTNLRRAGVTQEKLTAFQKFATTDKRITATVILVRLVPEIADPATRTLYEKLRYFIRNDQLLAYLSVMDDNFQGGIPLAGVYRDNAEIIFNDLWREAADI